MNRKNLRISNLSANTRTVNRSQRMVSYILLLLNVMYPMVFSKLRTPLNETYLRGVLNIKFNITSLIS
jgi:hypothetical protein